jgi:hypothetical protein
VSYVRTTRAAVVLAAFALIALSSLPGSTLAAAPPKVVGGGSTTITTLVLVDGSTMPADLPTHLGFAAIGTPNGATGQFQCLINGPGFTGQFMNLHGDVTWLEVEGAIARFGGDSNFGPYSVVVTDGPEPTLSLRWTEPFGPGVVGTEEVLEHGSVHVSG